MMIQAMIGLSIIAATGVAFMQMQENISSTTKVLEMSLDSLTASHLANKVVVSEIPISVCQAAFEGKNFSGSSGGKIAITSPIKYGSDLDGDGEPDRILELNGKFSSMWITSLNLYLQDNIPHLLMGLTKNNPNNMAIQNDITLATNREIKVSLEPLLEMNGNVIERCKGSSGSGGTSELEGARALASMMKTISHQTAMVSFAEKGPSPIQECPKLPKYMGVTAVVKSCVISKCGELALRMNCIDGQVNTAQIVYQNGVATGCRSVGQNNGTHNCPGGACSDVQFKMDCEAVANEDLPI